MGYCAKFDAQEYSPQGYAPMVWTGDAEDDHMDMVCTIICPTHLVNKQFILYEPLLTVYTQKAIEDNMTKKKISAFHFYCIFEFFGMIGVYCMKEKKNIWKYDFCPKVQYISSFLTYLKMLLVIFRVKIIWYVATFNISN